MIENCRVDDCQKRILVAERDALVAELILARARIEYLGAACNGSRHYDYNADVVLPRIDAVIASAGNTPTGKP